MAAMIQYLLSISIFGVGLVLLMAARAARFDMCSRADLGVQMVRIGVQALPMVATIAVCMGLVLAMQASGTMRRMGVEHFIPPLVFASLIKEMAPIFTAVVLIGRSGSALAAELGTMKVSQEVEALSVMGIDPRHYLVIPRFVAFVLMMPILNVFAIFAGSFGGWLYCHTWLDMDTAYFIEKALSVSRGADVPASALKALVFGIVIGVICCHRGMAVEGGAEDVGKATTGAVAVSLLALLLCDAFLTAVYLAVGI